MTEVHSAGTEPAAEGFSLVQEIGRALLIRFADRPLARYVYQPWDAQLESPRPYFHPIYTLGGDPVTLYRPHDHVWHKGIAWSLPNVGPANFWGGPTFRRGRGYEQLPNDGSMRHRGFERLEASPAQVRVRHRLDWVTEQGETWFHEVRSFNVGRDAEADAWTLTFATSFTNATDDEIVIGSPTTEGRENAGYGGLFWRGPRSFSGGRVYAPDQAGGDELMGVRAPWLGFAGRHDGHGRSSTIVFVDAEDNHGHPTRWFVRSRVYACLCPAPFFDTEVPLAPGGNLALRYAVVIADGDRGTDGSARLAESGRSALAGLPAPAWPIPAGAAATTEPNGAP
jgi:hypothetical protein